MDVIFAEFSSDGTPQNFYFESVHSKIPAGAIQISEEDYLAYVQDYGKWLRDPGTGRRVVAPPPLPLTREELLVFLRAERGRRLTACDWTILPDSPLTPGQRDAWIIYRQDLRDFPSTCNPSDPVWPVPPAN